MDSAYHTQHRSHRVLSFSDFGCSSATPSNAALFLGQQCKSLESTYPYVQARSGSAPLGLLNLSCLLHVLKGLNRHRCSLPDTAAIWRAHEQVSLKSHNCLIRENAIAFRKTIEFCVLRGAYFCTLGPRFHKYATTLVFTSC